MPDVLAGLLATEGLGWLIGAAFVAGMVRGFAGFGTAMVYLPVAGQFLDPAAAITTLIVKDLIGPLPNAPKAARVANLGELGRICIGLAVAMPLGVWLLTIFPAEVFRMSVSVVALGLVALLVGGYRYRGEITRGLLYATGLVAGVLGGAVGVPGPPVILLYMASTRSAAVTRAVNTLFLLVADVMLIGLFVLFGVFQWGAVGLGLLLAVPYLAGNLAGAAIFRPGAERAYRRAAYVLIALSAINGLPVWG